MGRSLRVLTTVLAQCLALTAGARAQDAPPSSSTTSPAPDEREALIEQGLRLRQQAHDEEALAVFQQAAALFRDGRVLAQIAFAEQAMGRWGDSYMHLTEALADASPWIQEHRDVLRRELAKIESNVGRLDVRTNIAVAKLTIDGREVGSTPLSEPLVVTAGAVVVSAQAPGYLSTTRRVPVHAGALSRTELVLVPEPTVQSADAGQRNDESAGPERHPGWLYAAGVGALVSVASLGPWLRSEHLMQDLKDDCGKPNLCEDRYPRERDKIERLDAATTGLLIGGLASSALAAATYWLWPRAERARLQPTASLSTGSFALGARFVH